MSLPRSSYYAFLEREFAKPGVVENCRQNSKKILDHWVQVKDNGILKRLFDKHPVLPPQQLNQLINQLRAITDNISAVQTENEFLFIGEAKKIKEVKEAIQQWVKRIITLGHDNLFNEKGRIHSHLLRLLGWDKYPEISPFIILVAYVGEINLQIAAPMLENHATDSLRAAHHFMNRNYGSWTLETLDSYGYTIDAKIRNMFRELKAIDVVQLAKDRPDIVAAVGATAAVSLVAGIGLLLAFAFNKGNARDPEPSPFQRPGL